MHAIDFVQIRANDHQNWNVPNLNPKKKKKSLKKRIFPLYRIPSAACYRSLAICLHRSAVCWLGTTSIKGNQQASAHVTDCLQDPVENRSAE
jgi:hypothetical protein